MQVDKLIVSIGRVPSTRGLGLEEIGVEIEPDFLQHLVDWDVLVPA